MKPSIKTFKEMNKQANEVANNMRQNTSTKTDSIVPTWLVDLYKKSGMSSVIVTVK